MSKPAVVAIYVVHGLLFLLAWRTGDAGFALPGLVSSGVFFTLWWKGKK